MILGGCASLLSTLNLPSGFHRWHRAARLSPCSVLPAPCSSVGAARPHGQTVPGQPPNIHSSEKPMSLPLITLFGGCAQLATLAAARRCQSIVVSLGTRRWRGREPTERMGTKQLKLRQRRQCAFSRVTPTFGQIGAAFTPNSTRRIVSLLLALRTLAPRPSIARWIRFPMCRVDGRPTLAFLKRWIVDQYHALMSCCNLACDLTLRETRPAMPFISMLKLQSHPAAKNQLF